MPPIGHVDRMIPRFSNGDSGSVPQIIHCFLTNEMPTVERFEAETFTTNEVKQVPPIASPNELPRKSELKKRKSISSSSLGGVFDDASEDFEPMEQKSRFVVGADGGPSLISLESLIAAMQFDDASSYNNSTDASSKNASGESVYDSPASNNRSDSLMASEDRNHRREGNILNIKIQDCTSDDPSVVDHVRTESAGQFDDASDDGLLNA